MDNRIRQRSLLSVLEENKFFQVSLEGFKQRVSKTTMGISKKLFTENEDYELLNVLYEKPEVVESVFIFINILKGKRVIFSKREYYDKEMYEQIFAIAEVKISNEKLINLIRAANGY